MEENSLKRREFMEQAGRAAAGLAVGANLLAAAGCARAPAEYPQAPSKPPRAEGEPIRLGCIGVGGRGRQVMKEFMNVGGAEVKILCDVKADSLKQAAAIAPPGAAQTGDHREVLKRDDVDAVLIATPDHWHAIIAIEACIAGKDVYVEKPLTLCVAEGRRIVQAARKHGRIVQMGSQQRSGDLYHQAREIVQSGQLGPVTMVRTWNFRSGFVGQAHAPDEPPPEGIDWDRWLGPRPYREYNPIRAAGSFRFFWDYAGGVLTDWGTHHFDSVQFIMNATAPKSVVAAGGRYVAKDITEVPDTLSVLYQYDGWTLEYSNRENNGKAPYNCEYGLEFCGTKGTLYLDRAGYMLFPEAARDKPQIVGFPTDRTKNWVPAELDQVHIRNFLACVRSREMPNSEAEIAHRSTTVSHLGNIAYLTGRRLEWDAERECFIGDAEANRLLSRTYRAPWKLPEV